MQIAKELTALFIKAKTFPNQVPDASDDCYNRSI